jgi:glutathione S-transferase
MLKIYGTSNSRATRVLWAAEELGLDYEHIPTPVAEARDATVNPIRRIPAIDDDGVVLCESMAINLYLAENHAKAPLWPASAADRGRVFQWSFWSMLECEGHFVTALFERVMRPVAERDESAAAAAINALRAPLKVLDEHFRDRPFLLGPDFTFADLNVASVLIAGTFFQYDFSTTPKVQAWLERCLSRPALQRARAMP